MRNLIILISFLAFLFTLIYSVYTKEVLLKEGKSIILKLQPVDPRSLMQGDYMSLAFELSSDIYQKIQDSNIKYSQLVLKVEDNRTANFHKLYTNDDLLKDEIVLNFTYSKNENYISNIKIVTNAYFFEEGTGKRYEAALYGEFKVASNGEALLVKLLDKDLQPIH